MGAVALLSACVALAPALPPSATSPSCGYRGFSGELFFLSAVFECRLTKHFSESVPSRLCHFQVVK